MDDADVPRRYRSVFISDVHLGTRGCQAELLLDFIRQIECERLYLVGDILDGWKLKGGWWWPQAHNDVVQKILRMARKGVAGDLHPRQPRRGGPRLSAACTSAGWWWRGTRSTSDRRRPPLSGTHGDEFDGVIRHARWLAFLGDWAYRTVLTLNTLFNRAAAAARASAIGASRPI